MSFPRHPSYSSCLLTFPVRLAGDSYDADGLPSFSLPSYDSPALDPSTGAFDDAEVIHVEGDVDPCRDMAIIQTELRLKDAEWVEKHLNTLKKSFRGTGNASLAEKAKKEEIVRTLPSSCQDRVDVDVRRRSAESSTDSSRSSFFSWFVLSCSYVHS